MDGLRGLGGLGGSLTCGQLSTLAATRDDEDEADVEVNASVIRRAGGANVAIVGGEEASTLALDSMVAVACGWKRLKRLECCMKLPTDFNGLKKCSWLCTGGSETLKLLLCCSVEDASTGLASFCSLVQEQERLFLREFLVNAVDLRYLGL